MSIRERSGDDMSFSKRLRRYCPFCELWLASRHVECPKCGADTEKAA